jgi:phosphoribosylglycinamide formyltransferase-1
MTRVAILASGKGSNAKTLIDYFSNNVSIEVAIVGSNRENAGVLKVAENSGIENFCFTKVEMNSGGLLEKLQLNNIDWVVLSGFLLKIPNEILSVFEDRILNIHPSLLPKHGGKGMFGIHVHNAVFESGENESGMTIHKVSSAYDDGDIVFQASLDISQCKSSEEIASKVLDLEHKYYPRIIEAMIKD